MRLMYSIFWYIKYENESLVYYFCKISQKLKEEVIRTYYNYNKA